jgi:hypothetical protein
MPSPVKRLREAFSLMSPFGKLSVAVALAALATLLFSGGFLLGAHGCGK